jgi:hypothetical protein
MEICLLKLLKYTEFIRPKEIIERLENLGKSLFSNGIINLKKDFNNNEGINQTKNKIEKKEEKSDNTDYVVTANKSEIIKIIKSKLSSSHFQLATALSNISYIEEKDNVMIITFTHKMHYDTAKKFEEMLNQEALKIIGMKHNNKFKIKIDFKQNEKKQTAGDINKENIINLFHGQELQ